MKRILLFMLCVSLATSMLRASNFVEGEAYRLVCQLYPNGCLMLGSMHGSTAQIYHGTTYDGASDGWWTIKKGQTGYTISNDATRQYLTYTGNRINGEVKGVELTDEVQDTASEWTFELKNGYYVLKNVSETTQWLNVRTDGSYLVGSYNGNQGSINELFAIYDANGATVSFEGSGTEVEEPADDFTATSGMTANQEYWERSGVDQPVVITTNVNDPVLYSIVNLRTGLYAQLYYQLQQGSYSERSTFYFVQQPGGLQIFTSDGQCISTDYPTNYANRRYGLNTAWYVGTDNLWAISHYTGDEPNGYLIGKLDNLSKGSQTGQTQSKYLYWNDYDTGLGSHMVGLYDADPGSTFVFCSADERHYDLLTSQGITFDGSDPTNRIPSKLKTAFDSLQLAGKELVWDNSHARFMATLPPTVEEGTTYTAPLHQVLRATYEGLSLRVNGTLIDSDMKPVTFDRVDCQTEYPLELLNAEGEVVRTAGLLFTYLPVVEVNVTSCNGSYYTRGSLRVTDPEASGYDSLYIADFKYRGATAQSFPKKAYAIKMRDANGESVDRKFFGLRNDNNWILDAMAVDPACMRNRVATDLWNAFCTPPYYKEKEKKALTGTRGHFVEVLLNGSYHGIYCMTEKLDRKQMKLAKYVPATATEPDTIKGLLYKSSQWSYEVFMGHEIDSERFPGYEPEAYSNTMGIETWAEYELKYPDYEDEGVDWQPLWNAVNFVAKGPSSPTFAYDLPFMFDMPVMNDYYLFIDLLLATDNHGKNIFFAIYDKTSRYGNKITIAPWDLDGTWGARWDGSYKYTSDATRDLDAFLWECEHGQHTLYYWLKQNDFNNWQATLAQRYAQLRQTYWQTEQLTDRFAAYAELFAKSHADEREEDRWPSLHSGIQDAVNYVLDWIPNRIAALDAKYGYDPAMVGINEADADAYFKAEGAAGSIGVTAGSPCTIRIYNTAGQLLRHEQVQAGFHVLSGFAPGIYVVNGLKVMVR